MNLQIIHEDKDLILCYKPAGVATQTKRLGQQDMESLLKNYRVKKSEAPYIGVVHRLDQPVEGLMVFAKNQKAAGALSKQVRERLIGKYYYAVSAHIPTQPSGVLEDYLLTDKKTNVTSVVQPSDVEKWSATDHAQDMKQAKLEYRVLESTESGTLFDVKLHTGRQHQIRVQLAHMGCPLVGDGKYGRETTLVTGAEQGALKDTVKMSKPQLALCSYRLEFTHPTTGERMDFSVKPQGEAFAGFSVI